MSLDINVSISPPVQTTTVKKKPYLLMGSGDMFIQTGPQKVKTEECDITDGIDTIEKAAWLMEKSLYFKSMVLGACNKILYNDEELIMKDLRKK